MDSPDIIRKKIKRAVTDSGSVVKYDESQPGISNLVNMYAMLSGEDIASVEKNFAGKLYSDFKECLGELMVEYLMPIQQKYNEIIKDKSYLETVLANGAESAFYRARKTMSKVYRKVGFIPKK